MRISITQDPFQDPQERNVWNDRGRWPARWIGPAKPIDPPFVTAYRLQFRNPISQSIRIHVTADERYELWLDGQRIGRGPERGDPQNWFFESYDLKLDPGEHVIVARVWSLGKLAPAAQMTFAPGFLLAPDREFVDLLATGTAPWEVKRLRGYIFEKPTSPWLGGAHFVGPQSKIIGKDFDWGFQRGEGEGWEPPTIRDTGINADTAHNFEPTPLLRPAMLPAMMDEPRKVGTVRHVAEVDSPKTHLIPVHSSGTGFQPVQAMRELTTPANSDVLSHGLKTRATEEASWQALIQKGEELEIPPRTMLRAIVDLENYYCGHPTLLVSGGSGAMIRVHFAESLCDHPDPQPPYMAHIKGDRAKVEGKYFAGDGDSFEPDGGERRYFETLWWRSGRFVEIFLQTADAPLTIHDFTLRETRYPLEMEAKISSGDQRFDAAVPIMLRGLQMCSHETYMDCPFYEQLMYVGDTRLEVLATFAITHDDLLPRKALLTFDRSRRPDGLTQSRFPSRILQVIPPFSLWWIAMVHDFAMWRGDMPFIKSLMPTVRSVIDHLLTHINRDGLVQAPRGWNFFDWVPGWHGGIPADGEFGVGGILNWHVVYTLKLVAELETIVGEPELSTRASRFCKALAANVSSAFFDEKRKLFADDLAHRQFSEHAQCLAILSGHVDAGKVSEGLLNDPQLYRTTIYFTHYLFETYRVLHRADRIFDRMKLWFDLPAQGFSTTPEMPEPSRSDCHAWGAHPLYHYFASLLGIRPASFGFETVRIEPLTLGAGSMPHPRGTIDIDIDKSRARITLPAGMTGELVHSGRSVKLVSGYHEISM